MPLKKYKGTILVSGASGIVGYGILRSLHDSGYRLIGTTIYEESPANCFSDIVELPPITGDAQYLPWLLETIDKYRVNMIVPGIEADMSFWNKHRDEISAHGTYVQLNNFELVELCLDKWKFYQKITGSGLDYCIETSMTDDFHQFDKPFILKPRCGFGARGIVKVSNEEEYSLYRERIGTDLMMQRLVGTDDNEYTVSAFFDEESQLCAIIAMKRRLAKLGYTEIAEVIDTEDFVNMIGELADILHPVGPTNFQFRKENNKYYLLEINPRISSSTSIRTKFGYNECQMCVDYFLEKKTVKQPKIYQGKAIRYTEDFIVR